MKKVLILIAVVIAIVTSWKLNPFINQNFQRVGALDIEEVRPETFLLNNLSIISSENPPKDDFVVYVFPWNIPGNNPTHEEKFEQAVTIPFEKLPFYGKNYISLNLHNISKSITAQLISQDISKEQIHIYSGKLMEVYRLKIKLPDDLSDNDWDEINKGSFSLSDILDNNHIVIPEQYMVNKDSVTFVCLLTNKVELPSMDYQFYKVKGKLVPIVVTGAKSFMRYNGLQPYVYVQSGIELNDQIINPSLIQNCN